MAKSKGADEYAAMFGRKATEEEHRFFNLRESGYRGPIDQNGHKANCLICDKPGCTRQNFAGRCN